MIIPSNIAGQGLFQVGGGLEAGGRQHLADAAIEALDHTVSLRMTRLDEPVVDPVVIADAIEAMTPGWIAFARSAAAIRKRLAVIRQDGWDFERRFIDETLENSAGIFGGFLVQDLHVNPPGGAINGDEQIPMRGFVRQLRQILDIGVNETRLIILKGFKRLVVALLLGAQGLEISNALATQATIQARARHVRIEKLAGDRQQVVQRE